MGKKKKVWVDIDKVVKASTLSKKLIIYSSVMESIPKGEKSKQ